MTDFKNTYGQVGHVLMFLLIVVTLAFPCEGLSSLTMSITRPSIQTRRIANTPARPVKIVPASLLLGTILSLSDPSIAAASSAVIDIPTTRTASSVYSSSYDDPDHPFCKRRIDVTRDGKTFKYTGQAVGSRSLHTEATKGVGCSSEEIKDYGGSRTFVVRGQITDSGRIVSTDEGAGFKLDGIWDSDGIQWNDGTKWTVNGNSEELSPEQTAGKAFFLAYVGFSLLAGAKAVFVDGWRPKLE